MSGNYIVKTLGCKANLYDSQLVESELQKRGWQPQSHSENPDEVKLCIVNSCTVTNEADRQTKKLAAKLSKEYPHAAIVVTGCGAEVDPEGMANSKGIHFVVGNQNKPDLVEQVLKRVESFNPELSSHILSSKKILGSAKKYKGTSSKHPMDREWPTPLESFTTPPTQLNGQSDTTRSFLKIQEGCNSFCTYCIIPYGRGPSRSLRPRELILQIQELIAQGIREIVLTGTNIGDYGTDWNSGHALDDLLEMIFSETSLERLRVSSLDPTEITPRTLELMKTEPRFCPHFHVSLQNPQSRILKLMKRRYQFEHVQECLTQIQSVSSQLGIPGGVFVGMDLITGFPGETKEEFEQGLDALKALPWSRLHVFPYSEREGTPATRLPGSVPQSVRVDRTRILNRLSMERLIQTYQSVLKSEKILTSVLTEKGKEDSWIPGHTSNYLRVLVPFSEEIRRNQIISVRPLDLMIDSQAGDVALVCKKVG